MTSADWIVLFFYFAGLLAVGAVFARSNKTNADMFVAGRSSPWWLSGVSAYMTMFSAGTFVVWGGITYEYGLVGPVICSVYGIAAVIAGRFFAGKWHDTRLSTAAEFVELRLGKKAFNFYTVYQGIYLCLAGLAIYALAVMICPLMPLPDGHFLQNAETGRLSVDWACVILASVVIAYTMVGGLWAVLMTDMLQFLVLTLCVVLVVPMLLSAAGGGAQVASNLPVGFMKPTAPGFSWVFLVGWMLVNCFQLGAQWSYIQRHLCVPTAKDARKGMYLFGCMYLVTPFLWMAPPLIYRSIRADADPQEAYILACVSVMPPGIIGLMIAAMFSATASSLSTNLNVFAGVLTDDVYLRRWRPEASQSQTVRAGRIFTILIGLYILAGALILPRLGTYRDIIILVGSLVGSSILLPTLWSLFSRRVGSGIVWATLSGGIAGGVLLKFGLSGSGWFSEVEVLFGLMDLVRTYPRESDLLAGILIPLFILIIAQIRGRAPQPGWERVAEAARTAANAELSPNTRAAVLPAQILAGALGVLGVVMLGLTPLSGGQWGIMLSAAFCLLILSGAAALGLRLLKK